MLVVLPSSQVSLPIMTPSPQSGMQGFPGTRHCHPVSTLLQSPEQPSPLTLFPSSQASGELTVPSPQTVLRVQGWPTDGQIQPFSIWQSGVQPSPPILFPSSHRSPGSSIEFPHVIAALLISTPPASMPIRPPDPLFPPLPLPLPPVPGPAFCFTPAQLATSSPKAS